MDQVAKRGRGRPRGSRNKKANLSGATVERICEFHKFNPAEKLIAIANGTDECDLWDKDDRLKATTKLFDAIHNKRALPAGATSDSEEPRNYEIVFVESADGFTLPGESGSEGTQRVMRSKQV